MNIAIWIEAVCNPCRFSTPARRSNVLYSFISRLLRRVQEADSYEHHAVHTVARAMIKAVTGSTHRLPTCSVGMVVMMVYLRFATAALYLSAGEIPFRVNSL